MISTERQALKQRHLHYEFSCKFWAEVGQLHSGHQRHQIPKAIIPGMMSKLKITNGKSWKYILKRARRASFWTELTSIFKNVLEDPSVVLYAIINATYTLESMTLTDRKAVFELIRLRIKELSNQIIDRLRAISNLYKAIMHDVLPENLAIESINEHLPFKDLINCKR
jgi:hypothetical protein